MDRASIDRAGDAERVASSPRPALEQRFLPFERQGGQGGLLCLLQWLVSPLLMPLRFLLCLVIVLFFYVACLVLGPKVNKRVAQDGFVWSLPVWRARLLRALTRACAQAALFVLGFYRVHRTYLEGYSSACRSRALIVSNHVSLFDILFFMADDGRSFVSKHTMLQVPLIGRIAATIGCIFVNRKDHSGGRATNLVVQRQKQMWMGADAVSGTTKQPPPPLVLFPEGTTTNGKYLLAFKTGAFVAGLPVQPVILAYEQRCFSLAYETIRGWKYILGVFRQFSNRLYVIYMPIYVPNEAERADPKLYARNVRLCMFQIMQSRFGTRLSDSSYADKLAYHTMLRKSWGEYVPIDLNTPTTRLHNE
jgi:lysophosphatidylcholine acyltransferase/lyso-PAF acetyltransferase